MAIPGGKQEWVGAGPSEYPDADSDSELSQLSEVGAGGRLRLIAVVDSGMACTQASDHSFSISGSCRSPGMPLSVSDTHPSEEHRVWA